MTYRPIPLEKSTATFIVAASDSLNKDRADYVCDGVDDQIEIQEAMDNMAHGGRLQLLEGTFDISNTLIIPPYPAGSFALVGASMDPYSGGTRLRLANDANTTILETQDGDHLIENIGFDGNRGSQTTGATLVKIGGYDNSLNHCMINESKGKGLEVSGGPHVIVDSYIEWNDNYCINVQGDVTFIGTYIGRSPKSTIIYSSGKAVFDACVFTENDGDPLTTDLITIDGSAHGVIVGNSLISAQLQPTNTYSVIKADSCSNVIINANHFYGEASSARYGVEIGNGCDYIIVTNNNFKSVVAPGSIPIHIAPGANTNGIIKNNISYTTESFGNSTGTGAQQTIAHGLTLTPKLVMLGDIDNNANPYQSSNTDAINIYVTATLNNKWWWKAEA
jgi:hypothetical protein